jgi:hypothetical protein
VVPSPFEFPSYCWYDRRTCDEFHEVYCRTERLIISAGAVARRNVSLLLSDSIVDRATAREVAEHGRVEELLDRPSADRREVAATDIEALEAAIDDAVYDLFGLGEAERKVIEEYLEVF